MSLPCQSTPALPSPSPPPSEILSSPLTSTSSGTHTAPLQAPHMHSTLSLPYQRTRGRRCGNLPITGLWKHFFFCCARVCTDTIPTPQEASVLQSSGLGRKLIQFPINGSASGFITKLQEVFPPLCGAGGFKLMRCSRSRRLVELPVPYGGYTVSFLKGESGLNKAVAYVVPIQADLRIMAQQEALSENVS